MKKIFLSVIIILALLFPLTLSGCSAEVSYTLRGEGGDKYYIAYCTGVAGALRGEIEILDYIDGVPVKEIADEGFSGTDVTKLKIPATVEKIGAGAFMYCLKLKNVEFADGGSLTEVSRSAFAYCRSLKEVNLPRNIQKIGVAAFYGCDGLKKVNAQGVCEISDRAFYECTALAEIMFPSSLEKIGELAFYYSALETLVIPEKVTDIGKGAFHTCTALKSVDLKGRVEVLDSGVFGYCIALESINLPDSLKRVEGAYYRGGEFVMGHAFHSCTALKTVNFAGSEENWRSVEIAGDGVSVNGSRFDNSALTGAVKIFA